jgi:hypothetical protein
MSTHLRRLEKIEASLTPKQAVLRWLTELHEHHASYGAMAAAVAAGETRWHFQSIGENVQEAATAAARASGQKDHTVIHRLGRRALRDAALLFWLHQTVNDHVDGTLDAGVLQVPLLAERLRGLLLADTINMDMALVQQSLSWDWPHVLDPDTAAAVEALGRHGVVTWDELEDLDTIGGWVIDWYISQGAKPLPDDAYRRRIAAEGRHPWLKSDANEGLDDIREAFENDQAAFEAWRRGDDYGWCLAGVRDAEVQHKAEEVLAFMRALVEAGTVCRGRVASISTVPMPRLKETPLLEGVWLDRYVVELAEWGAKMRDQGFHANQDANEDDNELTWDRFTRDDQEAGAEAVEAARADAKAALGTFKGRIREFEGRPYVHLDDFLAWQEGHVRAGDVTFEDGVDVAAWSTWREMDGSSSLAGVPVGPLHAWTVPSDGEYVVIRDGERLARLVRDRRWVVSTIGEWRHRQKVSGAGDGAHPGSNARLLTDNWPCDGGDLKTRATRYRAHVVSAVVGLHATQRSVDVISEQYFDGHDVLFPSAREQLDTALEGLDTMLRWYNRLLAPRLDRYQDWDTGKAQGQADDPSTALQLATWVVTHEEVEHGVQARAEREAENIVLRAKIDALRMLDENEAARDMIRRHIAPLLAEDC